MPHPLLTAVKLTYSAFNEVFSLWSLSTIASGGLDWSTVQIGQVGVNEPCYRRGCSVRAYGHTFLIGGLSNHYTKLTDHSISGSDAYI